MTAQKKPPIKVLNSAPLWKSELPRCVTARAWLAQEKLSIQLTPSVVDTDHPGGLCGLKIGTQPRQRDLFVLNLVDAGSTIPKELPQIQPKCILIQMAETGEIGMLPPARAGVIIFCHHYTSFFVFL